MFDSEDQAKIRLLRLVCKKGDFTIKGEATPTVASVFLWLDGLETKLEKHLKEFNELKNERDDLKKELSQLKISKAKK